MSRVKRNPGGKPGDCLKCPNTPKANSKTTNSILTVAGEKSRRICSVVPDSVYHFKKQDTTSHVYLLERSEGVEITEFPSTYKTGQRAGQRYITFRKTVMQHLKGRFPYTLELDNARMFTGLKMITGKDGTARGYGDNRNAGRRDCVLVALSEDTKSLDIAFVLGRADKAGETFRAWLEDVERACNQSKVEQGPVLLTERAEKFNKEIVLNLKPLSKEQKIVLVQAMKLCQECIDEITRLRNELPRSV